MCKLWNIRYRNKKNEEKTKVKKKRNCILAFVLVLMFVLSALVCEGCGTKKENVSSKTNSSESNKNESIKKEKAKDASNEETKTVSPEATEPEPTPEPTPTPAPTPEPVVVQEGQNVAYLTFDDGTSEQTDHVLDILAQYGVKATFFVTQQGGEENAARYRRIVNEGHSIGLHSVSHSYKQVYASLDTFIADVEGIRQFVLDTTGVNSHLYRFPGGSSNTVSNVPITDCIRYLNQNGYRYFDWNIDTSDAVNHNSQTVQQLLDNVFNGGVGKYHSCVILMHDSATQKTTVAALPQLIEGLLARGYAILPITDVTTPVQHKKAETVQ